MFFYNEEDASVSPEQPTAPTDQYFDNVSLLLNMDSDFNDSSANNHAVTVNGNASISTAESKFGGGSGYFDGSGDYITTLSTTDLQFGTSDFTIECWTNLTSRVTITPTVYSNYNTWGANSLSIFAGHVSADTTKYQVAVAGVFPAIESSTPIQYGAWTHVALCRQNGVIKLYINGSLEGSYNYSSSLDGAGGNTYIGTTGDQITQALIHGYIDDVRITKGVARYTTNFTPPSEAHPTTGPAEIVSTNLVMHLDAGNLISYPGTGTAWADLSGNGNNAGLVSSPTFTTTAGGEFGGFGVYGSGGYARIAHNSGIAPTSQITVEGWLYMDDWRMSTGNPRNYISKTEVGGYSSGVDDGVLFVAMRIGGAYRYGQYTIPVGFSGWHHLLGTYDGTEVVLYLDGQRTDQSTSITGNISYSASNSLLIGREAGSGTTPQTGFDFPGKVAISRLYDRGLSAAEALQNFEAQKSRFGL